MLSAILVLLLLVTLANAVSAPRLRTRRSTRSVSVSVLIPARNEASALPRALAALQRYAPDDTEIIVLDDESTDDTAAVVPPGVRLVRGQPLPAGWLGKNWACQQLAQYARGDVLIFCDADVTVVADAVSATVSMLEHHQADALTALPRQRYRGWWDRATIPLLLHFPLLATLPLALVHRTRAASVLYTNGQWLAIRRLAYERVGGHATVRASVVEDMALGAAIKRSGGRLVAALGTRMLEVRMYESPRELFDGFGKNLYLLLGGSTLGALLAISLFAAVTIAPLGAAGPLLLLFATRVVQAVITRDAVPGVLLHPAGAVLAIAAAVHSLRLHRTGRVTWKARTIATAGSAP